MFFFNCMAMHKELLMLMISSHFASTLACWSGGQEEDPSMINYKNKKLWYGWDFPEDAPAKWDSWMKDWKEQSTGKGGQLTAEEIANGLKPAGHDVADWPPEWRGLQAGFSGVRPPPWAYVPKQVGKSPRCYEPPLYGDCKKFLQRYGFNPFENACKQFYYSGCGGNGNNFKTQRRCEEACLNPAMGCDPDSNIPLEKANPLLVEG